MRRTLGIAASILFVLVSFSAPAPKTCNLRISWSFDFTAQPDVTNIVIYSGISSLTYTGAVNCGKSLSVTNSGYAYNTTYYFAGTCQSSNGLESDYGPEATFRTPKKPNPPSLLTIQIAP